MTMTIIQTHAFCKNVCYWHEKVKKKKKKKLVHGLWRLLLQDSWQVFWGGGLYIGQNVHALLSITTKLLRTLCQMIKKKWGCKLFLWRHKYYPSHLYLLSKSFESFLVKNRDQAPPLIQKLFNLHMHCERIWMPPPASLAFHQSSMWAQRTRCMLKVNKMKMKSCHLMDVPSDMDPDTNVDNCDKCNDFGKPAEVLVEKCSVIQERENSNVNSSSG